jgi:diphthine-ammonia ligase
LATETGLDPCGENGEYHTMAIDGPIFKEAIKISDFSKEKHDNRMYIKINRFSLKTKSSAK